MKEQKLSKRQKKFLLVLPLLALPFLTLFFWAMGGGNTAQANASPQPKGLNTQLPIAQLKNDSAENKLSFYQKAEKDSLKLKEAIKDDPNYKSDTAKTAFSGQDSNNKLLIAQNERLGNAPYEPGLLSNYRSKNSLASNEQQINQKLALLKQQMDQPQVPTITAGLQRDDADRGQQQLEALMQKMNSSNSDDPDMKQLSSMLDKIQEIQNPGLVQQKMKEASLKNRGQVFAVSSAAPEHIISSLDNNGLQFTNRQNGFYSLDNNTAPIDSQNAIEAVVHETQTLVAGATVKFRLANDIYINGNLIPKDNFVFGIASLNGERLTVKISSIRYRNSIFPVDLSVYDMDGAEGIYIPGAITRDVAKESADQSIQNLGFTTYDPSLGAQAASAGITAAKSLFSRKVRLVKVTVKAGYQVLLRDEKQKQAN